MMTDNHDLINREQLLTALDSLGYSDRMKRMALLGREHIGDANYSALLVSLLESGTAYEAHLALTGAGVVNDARAVVLALQHPKAGVRGRAAGLLPEVVTDPNFSIEAEVTLMSYHCRRQLLRSIVNTYRQDWAERLLPIVLNRWGAQEAVLLLAACSEDTVRSRLPELGYALQNWRLLTKYHPDLVAAYFKNALQHATHREKTHVWWTLSSAIEILSFSRSAIVLECALTLGPTDTIHPVLKQQLGILIQASAEDVFELLTREETREYLLNHGVPAGVLKKENGSPQPSGPHWVHYSQISLCIWPGYWIPLRRHIAKRSLMQLIQKMNGRRAFSLRCCWMYCHTSCVTRKLPVCWNCVTFVMIGTPCSKRRHAVSLIMHGRSWNKPFRCLIAMSVQQPMPTSFEAQHFPGVVWMRRFAS